MRMGNGMRENMAVVLPVFSFVLFLSFFLSVAFNVSTLSFDEAYSPLFGDGNLVRSSDGKTVRLSLDRYTGSGFISSDYYDHGFFSASIKLPSDHTAGIVVAFYTSNADAFEKTHDELDFEFLGNVRGKPWRVQTNFYGNGSTSRGREERYQMWFDPTAEFHRFSILWTPSSIIFYIDEIPIREVVRNESMGGDYPSKPMSQYATIWDASSWATSGGRHKVDYRHAPFTSEFTGLALQGCAVDPILRLRPPSCQSSVVGAEYSAISPEKRAAMQTFRQSYMIYSYCYDLGRYPTPPPECVIIRSEQQQFRNNGRKIKFGGQLRRHPRRPNRARLARNPVDQAAR